MHRKSQTHGSIRRSLAAGAVLGTLVLGAAPGFAQAVRTPYTATVDTGRANPGLARPAAETQRDMADFVVGNMLFVLLHEMAHVHVTEMGLPVLGREEDAADAYAAIALLKMGSDFSHRVLVQAAKGWFLSAERDERLGTGLAFYDEHGLDRQRAYQIVCLMVGSDPEKFGDLADLVKMPEERQDTCQGDYSNATYSWDMVLKPHRRTDAQPKITITTVYGEDKSGHDANAESLRALRVLERVAERAAEEFVWRRPFSLELQSCGKPGAHWDLMSHRLVVCYEMAEEFVHLYRDQNVARKPVTPQLANDLIARNITPKLVPAATAKPSVDTADTRIEQIAQVMTTQAIAFFARPSTRASVGSPAAVQQTRK